MTKFGQDVETTPLWSGVSELRFDLIKEEVD